MNVKLENNELVIRIPATATPHEVSTSGKSLLVATSHGIRHTTLLVQGKPVSVVLSAFIKR